MPRNKLNLNECYSNSCLLKAMVLTRSIDGILLERGRTETGQEVLESLYQGVSRMAQDSWSRSKESVIAPLTVASSRYGEQFMLGTEEPVKCVVPKMRHL